MKDAGWWTDGRRSTAAIALLLGSCLVLWPDALDPYTWPKLLVASLGLVLAAVAAPVGRLPRSLVLVLVAAIVVVIVAALIGPTPRASLLGRFPRYQGVPVLAIYAACVWAGARLLGDPESDRRRVALSAIAWVAGLLGLASALGLLGIDVTPASDAVRSGTVAGNATDQGLLAMMFLALLLRPAVTRREPLLLLGLGGSVVALAASGSRAGLLAALLVLVAHAVAHPRVLRGRLLKPVSGVLLVLVVVALAVPATRDRLLSGDTVTGRLVGWQDTWRMLRGDWLTGVGPSAYVDAIGRFHGARWVRDVGPGQLLDSPHLWPLQAWATGGIVLAVLAVAFAVLVVVAGLRRVRSGDDPLAFGALTALVAYGLALLTYFPTTATAVPALLLVGLLVARPVATDPDAPATGLARVGRPLAVGVTVVGLVFAASGAFSETRLHHGLESAARGELGPADQAFSSASFFRFGDPDVSLLAAQTYAASAAAGDDQAAGLAVERARISLVRTPDSYESAEALAAGLLAQQRVGDARRVLDRVVRNFPTEPAPLIQRAIARFGAQDVDGAVEDLDRAQKLDPDDPRPARLKAQILQRVASLG